MEKSNINQKNPQMGVLCKKLNIYFCRDYHGCSKISSKKMKWIYNHTCLTGQITSCLIATYVGWGKPLILTNL